MAASGRIERPDPKIDINETYYLLLCRGPEEKGESEDLLKILRDKAESGSVTAAGFCAKLLKEEENHFAKIIRNTCLLNNEKLLGLPNTALKEIHEVLFAIELPANPTRESLSLELSVQIAFNQIFAKTRVQAKTRSWCCQFSKPEEPVNAEEKYYCAHLAMYHSNPPMKKIFLSLFSTNSPLKFLREAADLGDKNAILAVLEANMVASANNRISWAACQTFIKDLYALRPRFDELQDIMDIFNLPEVCPRDYSHLAQQVCDHMQNKVVRVNFRNQLYRLCDENENDDQEERKLINRALLRRALIALKGTNEELLVSLQGILQGSRELETLELRSLLERYEPLLRPAHAFRI